MLELHTWRRPTSNGRAVCSCVAEGEDIEDRIARENYSGAVFGGEKIVHYNVLDDVEKLKSPLISYQIVGIPQPLHRLLLMVNELDIRDRSNGKM